MAVTRSLNVEGEIDFFESEEFETQNLEILTNNNFEAKPIAIVPCSEMLESQPPNMINEDSKDEFNDIDIPESQFANLKTPEKKTIEETEDEHDCFQNAQRFTGEETQSILLDPVNEIQRPVLPKGVNFSPRSKSSYVRSMKRKLEEIEIDPLTKTRNHLRVLAWRQNPLSRIWRSKYTSKETEGSAENCLFYTSQFNNSFYIRITSSFGKPQKISIGTKGNKGHKVDFDALHFDDVLTGLISIQHGSKSKNVKIEKDVKSLIFKIGNHDNLSIQTKISDEIIQTFSDRGLLDHEKENVEFIIPKGEFNDFIDSMLETKRFIVFLNEMMKQQLKVFEEVENYYSNNEGTCHHKDYYLKVVEIFHKMKTSKENTFPINLVLEKFTKLYAHRSFYIKDM